MKEDSTATKEMYRGTGRRKSAVAQVRISPGTGKILINRREIEDFFVREQDRQAAVSPLQTTKTSTSLDVTVKVVGGGFAGQAGAVRLGVARALVKMDPDLEGALRKEGHLTRDSRMKERKKYGLRGARRGFQFSKR